MLSGMVLRKNLYLCKGIAYLVIFYETDKIISAFTVRFSYFISISHGSG